MGPAVAADPVNGADGWARDRLGHEFADPALLSRALTHKSLGSDNYERLEFLGDRVLGAIIADWLFCSFPAETEGKLTRRFARLVSRETCAEVARTLGVAEHMRLGIQARSDGGTDSDNLLGDVMEALIGAVWLEGGMDAAARLVKRCWADELGRITDAPKHPKSAVQEWAAAKNMKEPVYSLIRRTGPHHSPRFEVQLSVGKLPAVEAAGTSKQDAETRAAEAFLAANSG